MEITVSTWTSVEFSLVRFFGIWLRATSQRVQATFLYEFGNYNLKLLPHLLEANELSSIQRHGYSLWTCWYTSYMASFELKAMSNTIHRSINHHLSQMLYLWAETQKGYLISIGFIELNSLALGRCSSIFKQAIFNYCGGWYLEQFLWNCSQS